jgi:hypothetical protein
MSSDHTNIEMTPHLKSPYQNTAPQVQRVQPYGLTAK